MVTNCPGQAKVCPLFMTIDGKPHKASELETELMRLSLLVRERRKQLARLDKCPNTDCPCRFVWREHVEANLAGQVGKVRHQVNAKPSKARKPKAARRPRK
jgi:hypothetical protein